MDAERGNRVRAREISGAERKPVEGADDGVVSYAWEQEWFEKEKERLEEEAKEHLQEAISNVQILSQNLDHLNDVGNELVNISAVWVKFLQQVNGSAKDLRK